MSLISRAAVATGLALVSILLASPSLATNTREAIKACDANPKCQFDVKADGVVISVNDQLIICPVKNGPCTVTSTQLVVRPSFDFGTRNAVAQFQAM